MSWSYHPLAAKGSVGSVYVRWGHDQCPSSSQLVYSGVAGGSEHLDQGGASNPLCLPLNPDDPAPLNNMFAHTAGLHGSEYESVFLRNHNHQVLCAVCYVSGRSTVHMYPAKTKCPSDWSAEYGGYLMAARPDQRRTQFTCVDSQLKAVSESPVRDNNGYLFFFVRASCNSRTSLPCGNGQYANGKLISCTVCTK